jgi:prophage regulatory protein
MIRKNIMNVITGQTFQMNQIINLKEVIQFTGLSRATIYNIMDERHKQYDPTFPKQANLTVGRVGWSAWEINQWIEAKLASR